MNNEILCGSSCVKYVLNSFDKNIGDLNLKMEWITELAICLKEKEIRDISILCFKSNLFYDYKYSKNINLKFNGFKFIKKCFELKIPIIEIELTKKELVKEIKENKLIILCVQSSVFNNDNSMDGGHFIILKGMVDNMVKVINPRKNKYEYTTRKLEDIIKYCKNYGSWRILIKEDI